MLFPDPKTLVFCVFTHDRLRSWEHAVHAVGPCLLTGS